MPRLAVLFEKGQIPRIYKNHPDIDSLKKKGEVLINPIIPRGIPPHEWKLKDGKIQQASLAENCKKEEIVYITKTPNFVYYFTILLLILNYKSLVEFYFYIKDLL